MSNKNNRNNRRTSIGFSSDENLNSTIGFALSDTPAPVIGLSIDTKPDVFIPVAKILCVANCQSVNLRQHPSTDAFVILTLPVGTPVEVTVIDENGWAFVQGHTGVPFTGYVMAKYLVEEG